MFTLSLTERDIGFCGCYSFYISLESVAVFFLSILLIAFDCPAAAPVVAKKAKNQ